MVVYEVTVHVEPELCQAYERYMTDQHISDVLATGAFACATFEKARAGLYRVRYEAPTEAILDRYLADESPRLRDDLARHFPTGIEAVREAWTELGRFP